MRLAFSKIDEDDLLACSELYVACFREAPWEEDWSIDDVFERLGDFLSCPKSFAIKATERGQLCGLLIGAIEQWNGARVFWLKEICVAKEAQRQGIGRRLMRELEDALSGEGVSRIYLLTQRDSVPSGFYGSLGFSESTGMILMRKAL
ncbi:GNAT family N-acetyltransferase [Thiorhodococcus minor]|uniref:GNAT family N-acetyltransferase n=1 Tax=Thiorhodococcus minor TaxID=57489 RepID=A0A6M0K6P8_9GAMM|nr:GNAT family N-acetyltransferase [Thiorhodococcus minor]NEV64277.1 GNAT family N-acetyltransferase [Thiorhodococcus minor]